MLKDLANVIKTRWPEMLLVIGFMAIGMFLADQLTAADPTAITKAPITMSQTTTLLYTMTATVFFVFFLILYLGFLATLSVNHDTPHDPTTLVRIGRLFFWRFIRFELFIVLYYFAVAMLIYSPMKFLFFRTTNVEDMPQWTFHLCRLATAAILAKPILLIPPIMICKNIMLLPAVKNLSDYRISDIKALPIIFITGILITGTITSIQAEIEPKSMIFNILTIAKVIISPTFILLTGMIGIWFITGNKFGTLPETPEQTEQTP